MDLPELRNNIQKIRVWVIAHRAKNNVLTLSSEAILKEIKVGKKHELYCIAFGS